MDLERHIGGCNGGDFREVNMYLRQYLSLQNIFSFVTQFIMQSVAYRHTIVTKLFQVVPLEAPGLVDVTTWLLLGSSLTMVCDLALTFL